MKKLMIALVAGFLSVSGAGAYAGEMDKKDGMKKSEKMDKMDKKDAMSKDDDKKKAKKKDDKKDAMAK